MRLPILLTAVLGVVGCPLRACAERPPQARNDADIILVGVVEAVTETWDLQTDYDRVLLRVAGADRGSGVVPGEQFEVTCFRWSRPWPGYDGASGQKGVPAIGDQVRVFAFRRGTSYEGAYPDWYDVLEPSPHNWLVRQWNSRKARFACYVALIAVSLMFGVWWARRRRARCRVAAITPDG